MNRKCAIFNYWWSWRDGHGASLTALALYKLIDALGFEPYLIITIFRGGGSLEQCKNGRHFRFIEKHARYIDRNFQTGGEYAELNDMFEHFIVGSDQVLRTEWVPDEAYLYSIEKSKNKIIMSGSFGGRELASSPERIERISRYLGEFSAVSVRELDAVEVYRHYFGEREDIAWIMDPVFLIDPGEYYELMGEGDNGDGIPCKKMRVLLYILDETLEKKAIKQKVRDLYDAEIIEDDGKMTAEEFLYMAANCEMAITDSYHGVCFSIIFNRPFYAITNEQRGASRMDTLRDVFGLEGVFLDENDIEKCDFAPPDIDYERVNSIIERERERGRGWLKEKLEMHECQAR